MEGEQLQENLYSALAHHLYNQKVPIQTIHRQHDQYDKDLNYHSHDFMELVLVTDGSATHSVCIPNHPPYNYRISREYSLAFNLYPETANSSSLNMLGLIGYIQQHYCEDITFDEISKLFHYGVRHLTRQFKKTTGETISSYIRHLRITKACSLLQNTDLKISEIASRVGISNCSLFCKTFKEITDITPSEYRRIPTISEPKPNLKHKQVSGESSIPKTFP